MIPYFIHYLPIRLRFPQIWQQALARTFPTVFALPHMSPKEFELLKEFTKAGGKVVEFGSGGSTIFFLSKGKTVYSVESDSGFIGYLQTFPLIKKKITAKKLYMYHADIGETVTWGVPKDHSKVSDWPLYYKAVWRKFNIQNPDIVLIDGRFRVMCALNSIPYINRDTVVMVHDFSKREHYKVIFDFFDLVKEVESLVVLKLKEQVDKERVNEVKAQYQHDYS